MHKQFPLAFFKDDYFSGLAIVDTASPANS